MPRGIKRLIVTEIWISEPLRGRGLGKRLMDRAKAIAARQKRRAIILETQSCNTKAGGGRDIGLRLP